MATKLIALNSNKFLWQRREPCDCFTGAPILTPHSSAGIGKLGRFKDLSVLGNSPALFYERKFSVNFHEPTIGISV
jgi:hypothetical protein